MKSIMRHIPLSPRMCRPYLIRESALSQEASNRFRILVVRQLPPQISKETLLQMPRNASLHSLWSKLPIIVGCIPASSPLPRPKGSPSLPPLPVESGTLETAVQLLSAVLVRVAEGNDTLSGTPVTSIQQN